MSPLSQEKNEKLNHILKRNSYDSRKNTRDSMTTVGNIVAALLALAILVATVALAVSK